jgi:hypothetical protein
MKVRLFLWFLAVSWLLFLCVLGIVKKCQAIITLFIGFDGVYYQIGTHRRDV